MNPYLSPANGPPPPQMQPIPSVMNRQKGKKQFYQKNHPHGQGQRKGQSCYNCGSPEHWAQHCPEPRRPIPVGSNHNRPQKRQKTATGPPGMLHGTPLGHQQQPHHGYPHPPAMHPGYAHAPGPHGPGPYGPPTPMSAHSQHPSQWQHPTPPPYYPHQGYPPYGGHSLPTPASAYGGQFPSPASPDSVPHQHHYFPPQTPYDSHGYSRKSQDYGRPHEDYSPRQQSWPPRAPSEEVPYIAPPLEPWMEELQSLDIDERKSSGGEIVWRPPQPVARPLPSKFTARDEVGTLPPLTSLPRGMSVSKYFLNKRAEEFQSHIRNTEDWPFMMKDPIFVTISIECETVSMLELISRRNKLFENHKVKTPEPADIKEDAMEPRSPSDRSAGSNYEGSKEGSMTPIPRGHMQSHDMNGEEYPESVKGPKSDDNDEDGYSPMEFQREFKNGCQRSQSPDSAHLTYNQSPDDNRDRESHFGDRDQAPGRPHNRPKHHGNQNKKKRGDRRGGNASHFRGNDRRTRGSRGSTASRPSRQNARGAKDESSRASKAPENANGHGGSSDGHRDQAKQMNRKRQRDASPEDKGPRRQRDDDVAPKNKIPRPAVAAAYSRRW